MEGERYMLLLRRKVKLKAKMVVLYCHLNVVYNRMTITVVNGHLANHAEGHECPR